MQEMQRIKRMYKNDHIFVKNLLRFFFIALFMFLYASVPAHAKNLKIAGERIWNLGRLFNVREGVSRKDDYLPPRILNQSLKVGPSAGKVITTKRWNKLLSNYYKKRGWNNNGIPLKETLTKLNFDRQLQSMEEKYFK